MGELFSFVLKILLWSAGLSLAIKYGGPYLPLPATATTAMILVVLPSLVLLALLGWRARQS